MGILKRSKNKSNSTRRISLQRSGSGKKNANMRKVVVVKRERKPLVINWRFFGSGFAMLAGLVVMLAIVGCISVTLLYQYRFFTTNEYFLLKTVKINGNTRLSSQNILDIVKIQPGMNLLDLSIASVENDISANPWVKNASVTRVLPETLIISIEEAEPAFWILKDKALFYADVKGEAIAPVEAGEKFSSLPTLEVEKGAEEYKKALPDLVKSLKESQIPIDMRSISWVSLSASRGVELYSEQRRMKLTIGLEDWLTNLDRLSRTMLDLQKRGELNSVESIRAQGPRVWVEIKK